MNLYLIGYRGVGKSTVARLLSAKLERPWCDADSVLEHRAGKTIRQIFAEEGEAGFREREAAVLGELAQSDGWIVATGGGVVLREANRRLLKRGFVVWLTASVDTIWSRLNADTTTLERRPNLTRGGREEIEDLLRARQPFYEDCANHRVDADSRTAEDVAAEVAAMCGHVFSALPRNSPGD